MQHGTSGSQTSYWEARKAALLAEGARKQLELDSLRERDAILHSELARSHKEAPPPQLAPAPAAEKQVGEEVALLEAKLEAAQQAQRSLEQLLEGAEAEKAKALADAAYRHELELQRTSAFWLSRAAAAESETESTLSEALVAVEAAHEAAAAQAAEAHERELLDLRLSWQNRCEQLERRYEVLEGAQEAAAASPAAAAAEEAPHAEEAPPAEAAPAEAGPAEEALVEVLQQELTEMEERYDELKEQQEVMLQTVELSSRRLDEAEEAMEAQRRQSEVELQRTSAFWIDRCKFAEEETASVRAEAQAATAEAERLRMQAEVDLQKTAAFWIDRLARDRKE